MTEDERAIRELVAKWFDATKSGDVQAVLDLMTEDVIFMTPGQEPFGKEAFVAASEQVAPAQIDGKSEIQELAILGDWAYLRNYIQVIMTPSGGSDPVRRAGYTLTILRKESDGQWRLARDANLLTVQQ